MSSTSSTFSAAGQTSTALQAKKGDKFSYVLTGTFSATVVIEKSENNGIAWENVAELTAAGSAVVPVELEGSNAQYRARCSAYTSGSPFVSLQSIDLTSSPEVQTSLGIGSVPSVTGEIAAVEYGNSLMHKTVLYLNNVNVNVVSVTTGNGVGGTKIYDFPEGYIQMHGCVTNLGIGVLTQADFTDGTPEGDIGIGTAAPANADALGSDATDDNFATATAFTMAAYVASDVNCPPEASANYDGSSTPIDMYLNALVDAADIDDDTTGELLFTGTVTFLWSNIGDV